MMMGNEDWENRPRKNGVTQADQQKLLQRHVEAGQYRQAVSDLNLIRAVQLGAALRRLKEG